MTQLILIRHGATAWNEEKRYQGHTDIPLTSRARRKMRQLAGQLKSSTVHVLYTSALVRAGESATILGAPLRLKPIVDERLNELALGNWEGRTAEELIQKGDALYLQWMAGAWVTPPQGESARSLRKRIRHFLEDVLRRHQGKNIMVVTHAGPIRMILLEALDIPLKHMFQFRVDPGSVSVLNYYPDYVEVQSLNNTFGEF